MQLMTKEIEKKLPALRTQEGKPREQVLIVVKFFDPVGSWTWFVTEGDKQPDGDWLFFGLVTGFEKEFGYFSLSELQHLKDGMTGLRGLPIERDLFFEGMTLADIPY